MSIFESNAMTFTFMSDGIPIVYYGQEQYFSGNADPVRTPMHLYMHNLIITFQYNREALWSSGYKQTDAYKLMTTLNQVSN